MKRHLRSKLLGATLVELMIGLATSGILLTGLLTMMMQQGAQYRRLSESYAELANLRFAIHWLNKDIQTTGFLGCTPTTSKKIHNLSVELSPLTFIDYDTSTELHELRLVTGRYQKEVAVLGKLIGKSQPLTVSTSNQIPWQAGQLLALTDCEKASLFAVSHIDRSKGLIVHEVFQPRMTKSHLARKLNHTSVLLWDYKPDELKPELVELEMVQYSMKTTLEGFGLFRNDIEILPGIQSFSVKFHLDSDCDGQVDTVEAKAPKDISKIRFMEISIGLKQGFLQDESGAFKHQFPFPQRCSAL